jgi:hypothetical protein
MVGTMAEGDDTSAPAFPAGAQGAPIVKKAKTNDRLEVRGMVGRVWEGQAFAGPGGPAFRRIWETSGERELLLRWITVAGCHRTKATGSAGCSFASGVKEARRLLLFCRSRPSLQLRQVSIALPDVSPRDYAIIIKTADVGYSRMCRGR